MTLGPWHVERETRVIGHDVVEPAYRVYAGAVLVATVPDEADAYAIAALPELVDVARTDPFDDVAFEAALKKARR